METLATTILALVLGFCPSGYLPRSMTEMNIKKQKEIEDFFRYNECPMWGNDRVIYVTYSESRMACYVEIRHDTLIKGKMYTAMFTGGDVDKERELWEDISYAVEQKYKHRFYFHRVPEFSEEYLVKIMEKILLK